MLCTGPLLLYGERHPAALGVREVVSLRFWAMLPSEESSAETEDETILLGSVTNSRSICSSLNVKGCAKPAPLNKERLESFEMQDSHIAAAAWCRASQFLLLSLLDTEIPWLVPGINLIEGTAAIV